MCKTQNRTESVSTPQRFRPSHAAAGLLAAALILCAPAPAWAGEYDFNVLGTWGGAVNAVFIEEDVDPYIAYVCGGRRVVILDVEDPQNIIELGSIDIVSDMLDVAVRDGLAYVTGNNEFYVIDVADPGELEIVWATAQLSAACQVRLYEDIVYVRNHDDLHAYDISDPRNPVYADRVIYQTPNIADFVIVGDLMYILYDAWDGYSAAGVKIADLTVDPFNLEVLGEVRLPPLEEWHEEGLAIAVAGDYAYITVKGTFSDERLAVINVSDPQAPFVAGTYVMGGFNTPQDVAVAGGLAYVADYHGGFGPNTGGLKIFDVATDPNSPELVGVYETHGEVKAVEIVGTRAYLCDEGEGLIILDISPGAGPGPVRLGNWHCPAELRRMDKVGDLLYVTDYWNGITILDVSDPASPTLVGVYQTSEESRWGNNWGIELRDGLAWLAAGYGHLEAVDVTDPANPELIGTGEFLHTYHAIGLELWGDVANVGYGPPSGSDCRFVNFNISDPENITHVGDVSSGGPLVTIDTTPGGIAFCARDSAWGLLVNVDTSDPTDPFVVYQGQGGVDLARDGDLLYLANENWDDGGLYVQNVTDPYNPLDVSHFPLYGAYGVALQGTLAYCTGNDPDNGNRTTLFALDVSDPNTPTVLAKVPVRGARWILVDGPYVYVTTIAKGLVTLELAGWSQPGDLNGDACVDQADLGILLADWGCSGGDCPGDADGDGDTDQADLGILLANWGEGC